MKILVKMVQIISVLFLAGLLMDCDDQREDIYENYLWISEISKDHPRLFINKKTFSDVKERALNDER